MKRVYEPSPEQQPGAVPLECTYRRILGDGFLGRCSADITACYQYWLEVRGERSMPSRDDLDPLDMGRFLARIILVDVQQDPLRMRYRLAGTMECEVRGNDPTGKTLPEHCFGQNKEEVYRSYCLAVETRGPVYVEEPTTSEVTPLSGVSTLFLPLSSNGDLVNMILVFTDYQLQSLPPLTRPSHP